MNLSLLGGSRTSGPQTGWHMRGGVCEIEGVYFNVLLTHIQTEIWEHDVPPPVLVMHAAL